MATIVCVDDDPGVLLLHKMLLEKVGHTVLRVSDGPTAVILCQQNRAALVVLDYLMPGMDGGQVAAELRSKRPNFLSCCAVVAFRRCREWLRVLVNSLIEKGAGPSALISAVRELLPPRAPRRQHANRPRRQSTLTDWQNAVMLALAERDPECRQHRVDLVLHAIGKSVRRLSQSCDQSEKRKAIARALSSLADDLSRTNKKYG